MLVWQKLLMGPSLLRKASHGQLTVVTLQQLHCDGCRLYETANDNTTTYKHRRKTTPQGSVGSFPARELPHGTGLLHLQGYKRCLPLAREGYSSTTCLLQSEPAIVAFACIFLGEKGNCFSCAYPQKNLIRAGQSRSHLT